MSNGVAELLNMLEAETVQQGLDVIKRLYRLADAAGRVVENASSLDETAFNPAEYAIAAEDFMALYGAYAETLVD